MYVVTVKYKVFIGLQEIAGYYGNLKKGFRDIDVDCTFIDLSSNPFHYNGDDTPNVLVKICKWCLNQQNKYNYYILKALFYILGHALKIPIFIWALCYYDIFIFSFGKSFFYKSMDLPILKFFNKKIIVTFNGSDGRPPYIDGARHNLTLDDYRKISHMAKSNISTIEKYANSIITQPAISHFHKKKVINYIAIGHPFASINQQSYAPNESGRETTILHSPSDPIGKGSIFIRTAIENLKKKGHNINFIEITGKSHYEVIKNLQNCDFIIDQVYSDLPLPGFATEAAWFGKPAVIGGYYEKFIHNDCLPEHIPPSLYCPPDRVESAIELLISDEKYRLKLGREAQEFVKIRWTPERVAKHYLQIIEGTIPDKYMFDPNTICYVQGYGMRESQSKEIIRDMIEQFGIESLCLSDKPELERLFREYAYDVRK